MMPEPLYEHIACMAAVPFVLPFLFQSAVYAAPVLPSAVDPGQELENTRERLEQQRIIQEMEEHRTPSGGVESEQPKEEKTVPAVRFVLKDVRVDASELLPENTAKAAYEDYIGKEVSVDDLYSIVSKLNEWYSKNSYITCSAYLPPQTIHKGVVHIAIIEGRNGSVTIDGSKNTRESYILNRLDIAAGKIERVSDLNRKLEWFNGTNDVKLSVLLQAGAETGTTDYVIRASEPRRDTWTLYTDRAGNKTTGLWRRGLFYTNRSLTGLRDALSLSYINAKGLDSVSFGYDYPIDKNGARMSIGYSANATEVVDGLYKEWDIPVKGHASSYGLTFTKPFRVDHKGKTEASLAIMRTHSCTDMIGLPIIDDQFNDITAGVYRTDYGSSWALYRKLSFTYGKWDSDSKYQFRESKNYKLLGANTIYQRASIHRQVLTLRMSAQQSFTDDLRPSRQYYIGGVTSVRGYPENEIGADSGVGISAEYSAPAFKNAALYGFVDGGRLWGERSFTEDTLIGIGFGIRANVLGRYTFDIAAGFPLRRDIGTAGDERVGSEHIGHCRVHVSFMADF